MISSTSRGIALYTKQLPDLVPNFRPNGGQTGIFPSRYNRTLLGSKTGQKVPSWKKVIKSGGNATSYYNLDRYKVLSARPHGFVQVTGEWAAGKWQNIQDWTYSGYTNDFTGITHLQSTDTAAEAQALTRLHNKIRSESYGTNALLILGELRETIHLLRNPLEAMHKGLTEYFDTYKIKRKEIRRNVRPRPNESPGNLKKRRARALVNAMAGSWLAFVFGAKPAISDAQDVCQTLVDLLTEPSKRIRVSGKSKRPEVVQVLDFTNTWTTYSSQCHQKWRSIQKSNASVRYSAGMKTTRSGPISSTEAALKSFGFQIQNFTPTVYELIPYSFLIDYFVNLGNIIEAACTDTSNVSYVFKTTRQVSELSLMAFLRPLIGQLDGNYRQGISVGAGDTTDTRYIQRTTFTRQPLDGVPIPPLVFSIPGSDSTKWFNMAALIALNREYRPNKVF